MFVTNEEYQHILSLYDEYEQEKNKYIDYIGEAEEDSVNFFQI